MMTVSGTPARLRLRTAVRRKSWNNNPSTPARALAERFGGDRGGRIGDTSEGWLDIDKKIKIQTSLLTSSRQIDGYIDRGVRKRDVHIPVLLLHATKREECLLECGGG